MRILLSAMMTGVALAGSIGGGAAQSPYDYPVCAVYTNKSGATSCYYSNFRQCQATISGIGGYCIANPYYRGPHAPY